MGIFSSIKDAIFGGDAKAQEAPASAPAKPAAPAASVAPPPAKPVKQVDVEARLDGMAGADKLNWRTSIVDLMKLVKLDPSFANRKELAAELGDTDYSGTAEENIWLHKQVMTKIAAHGGMVPLSLRS